MGSPPLAALHANPPESGMNNLAMLYQILQNKQRLQQEQALLPGQIQQQQQNVQASQLENQKNQIALNDQKAMTAALQDPDFDPKNYESLPGFVIKHGGSASAVFSLRKNIIDQEQALATKDKATLDNEKTSNDMLLGHLDAISGVTDPTQRATVAQQQGQQIIAANLHSHLDPQSQQMIQAVASGQMVPNDDQLSLFEKGLTGKQAQIENALKKQQTQEAQAKTEASTAEAKKTNLETELLQKYGFSNTAQMDSKYVSLLSAQKQGLPVSPQDSAFMDSYKQMKLLVPTSVAKVQFNLQNAGTTGTPGQPSAIAQAIANGSMKWQDAVSPRTPMSVKAALLNEVKGINPNFNSGDFDVEKQAKITATSGTVGQQLLAIGTAREHMKLFSQLSDALDNGDVQTANKIGNFFGVQFGDDKATNLRIAAQAFGGEVGRAFDGAGVVAGEREQAQKAYADYLSKGQFKGAIQTVDALLAGKQKAAHDWFDQAVQAKPDFGQGAGQGKIAVGQQVKLKNGKTVTVTAVHPDGSFDAK